MKELNEAKVLAVGPGGLDRDGKRIKPSVATGDRVLIPQVGCIMQKLCRCFLQAKPQTLTVDSPQYGGQAIKVGEEEFSLFRDAE